MLWLVKCVGLGIDTKRYRKTLKQCGTFINIIELSKHLLYWASFNSRLLLN
jgi:hypothetical protein